MTNITANMTAEQIEAAAWALAEKRAAEFSEHPGRVRRGFKWVNGIVNQGIHRTADEFIDACRQNVTDRIQALQAAAAEQAAEADRAAQIARQRENAPSRVVVEAGRYQVGDTLNGHIITGLGRSWAANADDASVHGVDPAASYIQYAYFN